MTPTRLILVCLAAAAAGPRPAAAGEPVAAVADQVNQKVVKLFGAGGFQSVAHYGTGVLVSADGHILTTAGTLLDTSRLTVHLYDGRRMTAAVQVVEPELDVALLRLQVDGVKPGDPPGLGLPHFDFAAAAARPPARPGAWVLAFGNPYEIAMRDEPVSVQRGVVAAYTKLAGRRGIFDFPYAGDVYIVDAVTNNPGAGGGALTDRDGNLLGLIGRELRNALTETAVNYAIPCGAATEVRDGDRTTTVRLAEFVAKGVRGEYKPVKRAQAAAGPGGYHGLVFIPDVLERTPPYVDGVRPGSPAAKAGVRADDLISFVDGEPVHSIRAFREMMAATRPGTTVRLEVRRGDNLETVDLTVAEHPKPAAAAAAPPPAAAANP